MVDALSYSVALSFKCMDNLSVLVLVKDCHLVQHRIQSHIGFNTQVFGVKSINMLFLL